MKACSLLHTILPMIPCNNFKHSRPILEKWAVDRTPVHALIHEQPNVLHDYLAAILQLLGCIPCIVTPTKTLVYDSHDLTESVMWSELGGQSWLLITQIDTNGSQFKVEMVKNIKGIVNENATPVIHAKYRSNCTCTTLEGQPTLRIELDSDTENESSSGEPTPFPMPLAETVVTDDPTASSELTTTDDDDISSPMFGNRRWVNGTHRPINPSGSSSTAPARMVADPRNPGKAFDDANDATMISRMTPDGIRMVAGPGSPSSPFRPGSPDPMNGLVRMVAGPGSPGDATMSPPGSRRTPPARGSRTMDTMRMSPPRRSDTMNTVPMGPQGAYDEWQQAQKETETSDSSELEYDPGSPGPMNGLVRMVAGPGSPGDATMSPPGSRRTPAARGSRTMDTMQMSPPRRSDTMGPLRSRDTLTADDARTDDARTIQWTEERTDDARTIQWPKEQYLAAFPGQGRLVADYDEEWYQTQREARDRVTERQLPTGSRRTPAAGGSRTMDAMQMSHPRSGDTLTTGDARVMTPVRLVAGTHSPPSVVVPMLQGSRRTPSVSGSRTMDSGRMSPPRSRHTPTADGMMTRERLPAGMSDDVPMSPVDVPKRDTTYRRTPWSKLRQAVISRRGSSMGHSVHPRHRTTPSPPTPQMGHHSSPELPSGYGKSAPKPARISPRANPY